MTLFDSVITVGILCGVLFLAYAAIRHKDLMDVVEEIRDILQGKAEDAAGAIKPYA